MGVKIIFETHSTTFDNEAKVASGWNDTDLSEQGIRQSRELGARHAGERIDAIFCSDLIRARKTAEIAFAGKNMPIIQDRRLRECNYGNLALAPNSEIEAEKPKRIATPFPNGESYADTTRRIGEFLTDLCKKYDGKQVLIIGHRATQYGLEHLINGVPLEKLVTTKLKWQPGWEYEL